jgi:hypothetical protein
VPGVFEGQRNSEGTADRDRRDLVDARASGRTGAGQEELANGLRLLPHQLLRDKAAEGQPQKIDLIEAQRPNESDGINGHRGYRGRRLPLGSAHAAVVESDHPVPGGETVDDPGIPVVQGPGHVVEKDHRNALSRAELPVREFGSIDVDGSRRRIPVYGTDRSAHLESSHLNDDFALGPPRRHVGQSLLGRFKGKDPIYHGTKCSGLKEHGDLAQLAPGGAHQKK